MSPAAGAVQDGVPDHVPPELVVRFPYVHGATTLGVPHEQIDPMSSGPEIIFVPSWPMPAGIWVIRTSALWRKVVMQTDHITTEGFAPFAQLAGGTWKMIPIEVDPPDHNKYRMILNPLLSPKAMAALDSRITGYAREAIAGFRDRGRCEFTSEFAFEYPIRIFLELMGMPLDQTAQFLKWEHGLIYAGSQEERKENTLAVVAYLNDKIAARKTDPGDDFISHIVGAKVDGRGLDDEEALGILFNLFMGGLDTVSVHLAFLVRYLSEHAEAQAYLRANPDKIQVAVEELMRVFGTAGSLRTCTKDLEVAGVTIRAGDKLMAFPVLSGRDAGEYQDPQEIRLDRAPQHISFGYGPHVCIGIPPAGRELRAAIAAMLDILPPFRVAPDAEIVSEMSGMMRPRTLPLVWDA